MKRPPVLERVQHANWVACWAICIGVLALGSLLGLAAGQWVWDTTWPPVVPAVVVAAAWTAALLVGFRYRQRQVCTPRPPRISRYVVHARRCPKCRKAIQDGDIVIEQESMMIHGDCLYRSGYGAEHKTEPFQVTVEQWHDLQDVLNEREETNG